MKALVTAHMGDVFEGGADLTVLPCGAKPSWTTTVDRWIERFNLPTPKQLMSEMRLSDVTPIVTYLFRPNTLKKVAYGASVLNDATSAQAIRQLGVNIGATTRLHPDIRIVETVLFGTGHGRLDDEPAAEALAEGFRETADPRATLWIYVHGSRRCTAVQDVLKRVCKGGSAGFRGKSQDTQSMLKYKDVRVAVIVALAEEYSLFRQYFPSVLVEKVHIGQLSIDILQSEFGAERIGLVCVNNMGNVAAAVAATRLLEVFDLAVIANIGLAAGTDKSKQNLGDVVVANRIRYYEPGKLKDTTFEYAPQSSEIDSVLMHSLQTSDWQNWPLGSSVGGQRRNVLFGTIASGEKVIASESFVSTLLSQDRKTIGIEMESYGIAAATFGRKERLLLIRGVTDFADRSKHDDARLSAMEGAIRFFTEAFRRGLLSAAGVAGTSHPNGDPKPYSVKIAKSDLVQGIANNYVVVSRNKILDKFKYRTSVIGKLANKRDLGELRIFCISLGIYFDEIKGQSKTEKAAGILEYVERKDLLSIETLEALIEEA